MPRAHGAVHTGPSGWTTGLPPEYQFRSPHLNCAQCHHPLECVDQSRRSGTWLGSMICPNCRSEYFYAYRWGRLVQKG
jgi:hypothetical protein